MEGRGGRAELAVGKFTGGKDGIVAISGYFTSGNAGKLGKESAGACATALAQTPAIKSIKILRFFN